MGKSNSKLSAESLERLKQSGSGGGNHIGSYQSADFSDSKITEFLENEDLLTPFLTDIFYQEVEVSDCMQTLFRGNCLASRIMSQCFRTFGSGYLKQLLEPHIKPMIITYNTSDNETIAFKDASTTQLNLSMQQSQKQNHDFYVNNQPLMESISYEVDSSRLEEAGDITVNRENLLKLTKKILDSILTSAANFPPQLNRMCSCLLEVLSKKYPNSSSNLKAVGTVIFLRFINPAIVSPYEFGIVNIQPTPKTMRGLMLVSKILQNIANNVEFSKEEHMLPFNDFIRAQFEPLRDWVSKISRLN